MRCNPLILTHTGQNTPISVLPHAGQRMKFLPHLVQCMAGNNESKLSDFGAGVDEDIGPALSS